MPPVVELLYGRRPVLESLRARRRTFQRTLLSEGVRRDPLLEEIEDTSLRLGVPFKIVPRTFFDERLAGLHHQGIALEAGPYPYGDATNLKRLLEQRGGNAFVLFLDHLQDPQNLGSILRSAEGAGVDAVVIPDRRAASVTPAVVRASAGASEHLTVIRIPNLVQAMRTAQAAGLWLSGLDPSPDAQPYDEADLTGPVGLVIGNESEGLSRLVAETCDFRLRIPMAGRMESLNAGAAAAIVLFEIRRRRSTSGRK